MQTLVLLSHTMPRNLQGVSNVPHEEEEKDQIVSAQGYICDLKAGKGHISYLERSLLKETLIWFAFPKL